MGVELGQNGCRKRRVFLCWDKMGVACSVHIVRLQGAFCGVNFAKSFFSEWLFDAQSHKTTFCVVMHPDSARFCRGRLYIHALPHRENCPYFASFSSRGSFPYLKPKAPHRPILAICGGLFCLFPLCRGSCLLQRRIKRYRNRVYCFRVIVKIENIVIVGNAVC